MVPENRLYTKEHEWVLLEGPKVKVGVTHHAQKQLGDIVYVELPKKGSSVKQMTPCGVIESVKAVSEIYSPVTGTVVETNQELAEHPEKINQDPYGEGWMFTVQLEDLKETEKLLTPERYADLVGVSRSPGR